MDNQSLVNTLPCPKASSGQYLLSSLHCAINRVGFRLTIRWIAGHSKVKGNDKADRLAKVTAAGLSSARTSLPPILRHPLEHVSTKTRIQSQTQIKMEWALGGVT